MTALHAIILGFVEGVTEFLPISSTGHLVLFSKVLEIPQTEFLKTFEISIQFGAILSILVLYFRSIFLNFEIAKKTLVAFLPTAVIGLIFYKLIKQFLLESEITILIALFLGGIFLILFERFHRENETAINSIEKITYRKALLIGTFQAFAMIPGISRAAATIVGGLAMNLTRKTIVEFSFLLAVPTMAAAAALDLFKSRGSFDTSDFGLLGIGFVTSFIVATLSVKFLINFIKNHDFTSFGLYRIIVSVIFWIIIIF